MRVHEDRSVNEVFMRILSHQVFKTMRGLRRIFLGHLNMTFFRNKFDSVNELTECTIHIFLVGERNLTRVFLIASFQFLATA